MLGGIIMRFGLIEGKMRYKKSQGMLTIKQIRHKSGVWMRGLALESAPCSPCCCVPPHLHLYLIFATMRSDNARQRAGNVILGDGMRRLPI
jgi:hypothetical protein